MTFSAIANMGTWFCITFRRTVLLIIIPQKNNKIHVLVKISWVIVETKSHFVFIQAMISRCALICTWLSWAFTLVIDAVIKKEKNEEHFFWRQKSKVYFHQMTKVCENFISPSWPKGSWSNFFLFIHTVIRHNICGNEVNPRLQLSVLP